MSRSSSRRRKGRTKSRRGWRAKLAALGGLILLAAGVCGLALWFWARRGSPSGEPFALTLAEGAGIEEVARELQSRGALDHPSLFVLYARMIRGFPSIPAGTHLVRRGLAPAALLTRVTRSRSRSIVKLTVVEGFNRFQIAERLEALEVSQRDAFLAASTDSVLLGSLGLKADSAEGYLFPATYELYVNSDARSVVQTLVTEALQRFARIEQRHVSEIAAHRALLGWDLREFVTLASIVEKEAADASEHGTIASVFYNRLRDPHFLPKQMLQSDPTAAYGCLVVRSPIASCRNYVGSVTPAMLRDPTNPYNTYKQPGLPPGPISNPSESALEAVIAPPTTPYFFFVTGRSKRHVFSRTLLEHERAIATGLAPIAP